MIKITPCQIPNTQDSPSSCGGGGAPLKKHWRWEYIPTSKNSKFHINDNPATQCINLRLLETLAATPLKHIM